MFRHLLCPVLLRICWLLQCCKSSACNFETSLRSLQMRTIGRSKQSLLSHPGFMVSIIGRPASDIMFLKLLQEIVKTKVPGNPNFPFTFHYARSCIDFVQIMVRNHCVRVETCSQSIFFSRHKKLQLDSWVKNKSVGQAFFLRFLLSHHYNAKKQWLEISFTLPVWHSFSIRSVCYNEGNVASKTEHNKSPHKQS